MRTQLLLILAFMATCISIDARMSHLKTNRTPKVKSLGDACEECESIIKRIVEVAKDPQKVEELKILLSILCKETSYEDECKLFVSRLDLFLDRILPFLKDPHHVCKVLHICENKRIERHRALAQFYASLLYSPNSVQGVKDVVCEECQVAAHELDRLLQEKPFQQEVHDWISQNVCAHLGKYKGTCDIMLDDFLPEFFTELHYIIQDNRQFCVDLELCEPRNQQIRHRLPASTRPIEQSNDEQVIPAASSSKNRRMTMLTTIFRQ